MEKNIVKGIGMDGENTIMIGKQVRVVREVIGTRHSTG